MAEWGVDSIDGLEEIREIHLFPGGDFETRLYDDDGETYGYLEGNFWKLILKVEQRDSVLVPSVATEGAFRPAYRRLKFIAPDGFQVEPAEAATAAD